MPDDSRSRPAATACVVLGCADLDATCTFFRETLGFRLERVFPADDPREIDLGGVGIRLRLRRHDATDPSTLVLPSDRPRPPVVAPNGTRIEFTAPTDATPPLVPDPQFAIHAARRDARAWHEGRAGMMYRDLIPGRLGGALIASHIRIVEGGPVPDFVHFHAVRFQAIYCLRGEVRVAYEDQGEPFWLRPGDCVLQPPGIRHRVLECTAGLEVLEVGCPAEHDTWGEHELTLPNDRHEPDRVYGDGQRFVRHEADGAPTTPWAGGAFERRDLGIGAATAELATLRVAHCVDPAGALGVDLATTGDGSRRVRILFVTRGVLEVRATDGTATMLEVGDNVVLPGTADAPGCPITASGRGTELLELTLDLDRALALKKPNDRSGRA